MELSGCLCPPHRQGGCLRAKNTRREKVTKGLSGCLGLDLTSGLPRSGECWSSDPQALKQEYEGEEKRSGGV